MKTSTPLDTFRRLFAVMMFLVAAAFASFLIWLYVAFGRLLTGDVETAQEPELLTSYDEKKFTAAVGRMKIRRGLPDVEAEPRNPFGVPLGQ